VLQLALSSGGSVVVTLVVLGYILWNQLQVRIVRSSMLLPVVLLLLGAANLTQYTARHPFSSSDIAILAASLLLLAIGLGAARAYTVRLWRDGDKIFRQGSYVTVLLWLVGTALHIGVESLAHGAATTDLLYLGLTLVTQRMVLSVRASRLEH
jgi:GAF domain-containing protein